MMVVDAGGPVPVQIPRPAVWALAGGEPWLPTTVDGVVDPAVRAAVARALAGIQEIAAASTEPGKGAEVAVLLALRPGLDRAAVDDVVTRVASALAADETVSRRVDSLEVRLRTA